MKGRNKANIFLKLDLLQTRKELRGDSHNIKNQMLNIKMTNTTIYNEWLSQQNIPNIYKDLN